MIPELNFSPSAADARPLWRECLAEPHFYSRQEEFHSLVQDVSAGLKEFCRTDNHVLLLTSAGTGALECALAALPPDKRLLVVRNGYFGNRLLEIARLHCHDVALFDLPFGEALTAEHETSLTAAVKVTRPDAVACVHLETSSTLLNDVALVSRLAREHGALTIVDGISSVGSVATPLNEWGVDCFVASIYKALTCPVGLSFILVNDAFLARAQRRWSYYFDLHHIARAVQENHFLWSPNVLTLHCLKRVLEGIKSQGQDHYFAQLEAKAAQFRSQLAEAGLSVFGDPRLLSPCFTAVLLKDPVADKWISHLKHEYGIIIGKGFGDDADHYLRIGHYAIHTPENLQYLAKAMKEIVSNEL